jgi:putative SOS response-associated peptidase YedK
MCFNKSNHEKKQRQLEKRYGAENRPSDKLTTHYHESGFQHLEAPIITVENPNQFSFYNWGIIPRWQKNVSEATKFWNNTLNAISEEVFEKPSYRACIPHQRCIIPVTGFFEHMDFKGKKYPHFIHLKSSEIFSLAGIYEHWTDKESGKTYKTYSILTCPANPLMAKVHNLKKRMPVILPMDLEKDWLKADLTSEEIKSFFLPYPDDDMVAYTISKLITSRSEPNDVPAVQQPFTYPELNTQQSFF